MPTISHHPDFPLDSRPRLPTGLPASTLQPFAPGDILVGATQLNNPTDDHAGIGRIFQFDADLKLRGVGYLAGTTHLVCGLSFAPDGVLWAQDPWARVTVRVDQAGRQLPVIQFDERAFSKVHFLADGSLLFTENLCGSNQPEPLTTRFRPLPGHRTRLGDGGLWRYVPNGELFSMYEPEVHGGMSGSMGVTHSVLSADQSRLFYVSETGPRLMQFDLRRGRQLTDLRTAADRTMMHFDLSLTPEGLLMVAMGNRVDAMTQDGVWLRNYRLPGFGWALIEARSGSHAYVGNWFSGELRKLDLDTGETVASVQVAEKCMAGIAEYLPGPGLGATKARSAVR